MLGEKFAIYTQSHHRTLKGPSRLKGQAGLLAVPDLDKSAAHPLIGCKFASKCWQALL